MMLALLLALSCGSDRRAEKTLTDPGAARALAPAPTLSTIAQLGALPRTARRRAYIVEGRIVAKKVEQDGDYHLVLSDDAGRTMIVEAPLPACAAGSLAIAAVSRARTQAAAVRVGDKVRAVGVWFADKPHNQAGAARNFGELHPLLSIVRIP